MSGSWSKMALESLVDFKPFYAWLDLSWHVLNLVRISCVNTMSNKKLFVLFSVYTLLDTTWFFLMQVRTFINMWQVAWRRKTNLRYSEAFLPLVGRHYDISNIILPGIGSTRLNPVVTLTCFLSWFFLFIALSWNTLAAVTRRTPLSSVYTCHPKIQSK